MARKSTGQRISFAPDTAAADLRPSTTIGTTEKQKPLSES